MKQYRILRIAALHYNVPMAALYSNHCNLALKPYSEQQSILFENNYC